MAVQLEDPGADKFQALEAAQQEEQVLAEDDPAEAVAKAKSVAELEMSKLADPDGNGPQGLRKLFDKLDVNGPNFGNVETFMRDLEASVQANVKSVLNRSFQRETQRSAGAKRFVLENKGAAVLSQLHETADSSEGSLLLADLALQFLEPMEAKLNADLQASIQKQQQVIQEAEKARGFFRKLGKNVANAIKDNPWKSAIAGGALAVGGISTAALWFPALALGSWGLAGVGIGGAVAEESLLRRKLLKNKNATLEIKNEKLSAFSNGFKTKLGGVIQGYKDRAAELKEEAEPEVKQYRDQIHTIRDNIGIVGDDSEEQAEIFRALTIVQESLEKKDFGIVDNVWTILNIDPNDQKAQNYFIEALATENWVKERVVEIDQSEAKYVRQRNAAESTQLQQKEVSLLRTESFLGVFDRFDQLQADSYFQADIKVPDEAVDTGDMLDKLWDELSTLGAKPEDLIPPELSKSNVLTNSVKTLRLLEFVFTRDWADGKEQGLAVYQLSPELRGMIFKWMEATAGAESQTQDIDTKTAEKLQNLFQGEEGLLAKAESLFRSYAYKAVLNLPDGKGEETVYATFQGKVSNFGAEVDGAYRTYQNLAQGLPKESPTLKQLDAMWDGIRQAQKALTEIAAGWEEDYRRIQAWETDPSRADRKELFGKAKEVLDEDLPMVPKGNYSVASETRASQLEAAAKLADKTDRPMIEGRKEKVAQVQSLFQQVGADVSRVLPTEKEEAKAPSLVLKQAVHNRLAAEFREEVEATFLGTMAENDQFDLIKNLGVQSGRVGVDFKLLGRTHTISMPRDLEGTEAQTMFIKFIDPDKGIMLENATYTISIVSPSVSGQSGNLKPVKNAWIRRKDGSAVEEGIITNLRLESSPDKPSDTVEGYKRVPLGGDSRFPEAKKKTAPIIPDDVELRFERDIDTDSDIPGYAPVTSAERS